MDAKVALVTGAGFSSRKPRAQKGVEMLQLDVQSDSSVEACIAELMTRAGRLDLLVDNAGQIHASVIAPSSRRTSGAKVARAIVSVAKSRDGRLRHRVGEDARWVPRFESILPERFFRRAILRRFSVNPT